MSADPLDPDLRSPDELFAIACAGDWDDETAWEAIWALRARGTQEVFDQAGAFCQSSDPKQRARAADVLGQLGATKGTAERPFAQPAVPIVAALLHDPDADVVYSAAWALAHLHSDSAPQYLLTVRTHPDPDVRHAVATGLGGVETPEAIQALVELMEDPEEEVRDWATFSLGTQSSEQDSDQIRAALRSQLQDLAKAVRQEAIWGLAHRRDPDGLHLLLQRLEADEWVQGDEDTAAAVLALIEKVPVEQLRIGIRRLLARR